jgi:hypothetical protein
MGQSSGFATEITSTNMGFLTSVTAGTAAASKALVLGASKEIGTITTLTATTAHVTGVTNHGVDADGTQGIARFWPATTGRGQLDIKAGLNTGDDIVTLTTGGNTSGNITVSLPIVTGTLLTNGAAAIQAGADASAGTVELWPATTNSGTMKLQVADNTFDAAIILTNADHGQSTTYTLVDAGAANAYFLTTADSTGGSCAATIAEIDRAADISAKIETVTTTNAIAATEYNKTFFLNAAGGFTSTLPAVASSAGHRYRFIAKTAPTTAYILTTFGAEGAIIIGNVSCSEINTATDDPFTNGATSVNMVANQFKVGDWLEVISDGVKWYLSGHTQVTAGVTFA